LRIGKKIYKPIICLACRSCNEFKSNLTESIDPLSGVFSPLLKPRQKKWADHFVWSADGTGVEGITAVARATIIRPRMNNPLIIVAPKHWVISGRHRPND
jgi:hypothetical protein